MNLSNFDTSNVTNVSSMFYNCSLLETIMVGTKWNMDKVTDSGNMFQNCTKLPNFDSTKIDKTNANTSSSGYLTLKTA